MKWFGGKAAKITISLAAMALILFLSAACDSFSKTEFREVAPSGATGAENGNTPPERKLNLAVYYVKMTPGDVYLVREIHKVPFTREVARAALEELINADPITPGAVRVLPPATKIRGINIRDGLATVDFSREALRANVGASGEVLGIQSIVNTLTELPGVRKVSFLVEGKLDQEARDWWGHVGLYTQPFERDVVMVHEPAIWVIYPQSGQKVRSPLEVRGSARVFEAAVSARLRDGSGKILAVAHGVATRGAPERGDFVISIPFNVAGPGSGNLEVFWGSPKDGREMDLIKVPVTW